MHKAIQPTFLIHKQSIQELLNNALNIYNYGSVVYGTYIEGVSDKDMIVIVPDIYRLFDEMQFTDADNYNYTFYSQSTWREMLQNHDVCAIESYFLPPKHIVRENMPIHLTIDKVKLRESFSHVASNSWVKCKKKLTVAQDFAPRIGKKSLWHSLRILSFGIQIAKYGCIRDYNSMNHLYDEIVNCDINDYAYYKEKYQALYNALKSEFRQVAPM